MGISNWQTFLDAVLSPYSLTTFFAEFWEREIFHVCGRDRTVYESLFRVEDMDVMLASGPHGDEDVEIFMGENRLKLSHYQHSDGTIKLENVVEAFSKGYAIVSHSPQQHNQAIDDLCFVLESILHHRVLSTIFFSPKGNQYQVSLDGSQSVLILQLEGDLSVDIDENRDQRTLVDGDLLYIPRGHRISLGAMAGTSLCLILKVQLTTLGDLLTQCIERQAVSAAALRNGLPYNYQTQSTESISEALHPIWDLINEQLPLEAGLNELRKHFLAGHRQTMPGHFQLLREPQLIHAQTRVRRRPHWLVYQPKASKARLLYSGGSFSGPDSGADAFAFIQKNECFLISDIDPQLTDEAKVGIVDRLIQAGLLMVEDDV